MSLLIHPGDQQRHVAPARKLSFTMVPAANTVEPGRLFVAWDGGFQLDEAIGERRARPHRGDRPRLPRAAVGAGDAARRGWARACRSRCRFPTSLTPAAGADGAPDAVGRRVVGIRRRAHGREPVVRAAPGAERQGGSDRVRAGRRAAAPAAADRRHQPAARRRGHLVALRRMALRRHRRAGQGVAVPPATGQSPATPSQAATRGRHAAQPEAGPDHAARAAPRGHHHGDPVLQRRRRSACASR